MERSFTLQEAARRLKIDVGTLRDWVARKYINVDFPSRGRGTANELSAFNLYHVAMFKALVAAGASREKAAEYLATINVTLRGTPEYMNFDFLLITGEPVDDMVPTPQRYFFNEDQLGRLIPWIREQGEKFKNPALAAFTLSEFRNCYVLNWRLIREDVAKALK